MSIAKGDTYKTHIERDALSIMMNVRRLRPPMPLQVLDLSNLARLTLTRPDSQTLLWMFRQKDGWILGNLFSVPYWRGNLPIFSYVKLPLESECKAYLAYNNIGGEETFLTDSNEDPKYLYAAIIETPSPPKILNDAMKRKNGYNWERPLFTKARDVNSLVRLLMIMSDSAGTPPIWNFRAADKHVLGVLTPLFDYYDANALPVFVYVETDEPPRGGFIRYIATNGREEYSYTTHIGDMKYFYARIINLVDVPCWFSRRSREGSRLRG